MAALRGGMTTVIVPAQNEPDLEEIDPNVRQALHFVVAESMDTVLGTALARCPEPLAEPARPEAAPDAKRELVNPAVPLPKPSALPQ